MTSRSKAVRLKTKSNANFQLRRQSRPRVSYESTVRFHTHVSKERFYQMAEDLLQQINDPVQLAKCAVMIGEREPGGPYYRARYWARVAELLAAKRSEEAEAIKFGSLCRAAGIHPIKARLYTLQGRALENVDEEVCKPDSLRSAPAILLDYALRQKQKAAEYLTEAALLIETDSGITLHQIHRSWCRKHGGYKSKLDIIKPSDWWAFSHPKWRKEEDFPGSIPGEVYANALYYFAPQRGVAVDPMAGSGMLRRVYNDRARWQKERNFKLKIYFFDLYPRRRYIKRHDARQPLPIKADWIFLDPPYFGQSSHLYNGDLASATTYDAYLKQLQRVIKSMTVSLNKGGRLCIFLPKWSGLKNEDPNFDLPSDAYNLALKAGLNWVDAAYVSRGRQQEPGSAIKNIFAKRNLRMRSDTCILNVFEKPETRYVKHV